MGRRIDRWAATTVMLGFVGCLGGGIQPLARVPVPPDTTFTDLNGEPVRLADSRGKVVLLDVWATWCTPCEASMPFYAELHEAHQAEGFEVLAVSVDQNESELQDFLRRWPLRFTVVRDPEGKVVRKLGVRTMPTAFLIGRTGRTLWVHEGFVSVDEAEIRSQVQAALERRPSAMADAKR